MGWWAYLRTLDDDPREWNYTHNTNRMANDVLGVGDPDDTWWRQLRGLDATAGAELLGRIIDGLEADPGRYRAMDSANGWGDYDTFLALLHEMRDASLKVAGEPSRWSTSG